MTATEPTTSPDLADAYASLRGRVGDLIRAASPEQLQAIAPATPEWRIHDVLAHVVGITSDILAGHMDGVASDAWTAAQVDARSDTPTLELLDEWTSNAAQVEPMLPGFGTAAGQMIADAATHEHDIRAALGRPDARESDAVHIGSAWMAQWMGLAHTNAGHGALRIETDLWTETYGDGEPATTLGASAFELLRAATGRRSAAQIDAFDWNGPPRPEVVVMIIFTPRGEDFHG